MKAFASAISLFVVASQAAQLEVASEQYYGGAPRGYGGRPQYGQPQMQ